MSGGASLGMPDLLRDAARTSHLVLIVVKIDLTELNYICNIQIHAAGSGVGTAAIQLAVGAGATVFAVAGTDSKLEHARRYASWAVTSITENVKHGTVYCSCCSCCSCTVVLC